MAPEIHLEAPYQGKQVDLFAAAMILFIMIAQHPPFTEAKSTDPFYKCIAGNRADIFWRTHSKNKPGGESFFSNELKELITSMLQVEPSHRPSMAEIMSHSWMQQPMPSIEEIKASFYQREKLVRDAMDAEKAEKDKMKQQLVGERRTAMAMRSGKMQTGALTDEILDVSEEALNKPTKPLDTFDQLFAHNT